MLQCGLGNRRVGPRVTANTGARTAALVLPAAPSSRPIPTLPRSRAVHGATEAVTVTGPGTVPT